MSFKDAAKKTPHLEHAWMTGLGALRAQDKPHIVPSEPRQLRGSIDVDTNLQNQHPDSHRWDYAIGYRHANRRKDFVYWVEIHTANDKEVKVVLNKLLWLRN